jgi:hypothetical protein
VGTLWPLSNQLVWDNEADLSPGAKVYFYEGGTTTPLVVFIDYEQTMEHSIPVVSDGNGRWPAVFVPFGPYKYAQFTSRNVQIGNTVDNIPNIDPTPPETDVVATSLLNTGDVFFSFIDGTRAGAVRCNGRSIGNGSSAGTERANADTENLFIYLWNNVVNAAAPVSGGRGASAGEDFAANKTIGLPDLRAAAPFGLATMGNSNNGLLGSAPVVVGTAIDPGSILGANTHVLTEAQLASHLHGVSITSGNQSVNHTHGINFTSAANNRGHTHTLDAATVTGSGAHGHTGTSDTNNRGHTHAYNYPSTNFIYAAATSNGPIVSSSSVNTGDESQNHTHTFTITNDGSQGSHGHDVGGTTDDENQNHTHAVTGDTGNQSANHTHGVSGNTGNTGSGTAHNTLPRATLGTYFIKL